MSATMGIGYTSALLWALAVLASGVACQADAQGGGNSGTDPSATSITSREERSSRTDELSIPVGPLKFTVGPQDDGNIGAALKGGLTDKLFPLKDARTCFTAIPTTQACDDLYATMNFNLDAGWRSGSANKTKNNASISWQPSVYWMRTNVSLPTAEEVAAATAYQQDCLKAVDGKSEEERKKIYATYAPCIKQAVGPRYADAVALTAYPDLEYRYGHFNISGANYSANQLIIGGGIRALYPAKIGGWFGAWPYVSAGYYTVKSYGVSNVPLPPNVQDHYLVVNERAELFVPGIEKLTGSSVLVLFDLTESLPTSGNAASGWRVARLVQLIVDTKSAGGLKPAVTYRSGEDKGLTYDKQVIFGLLWDFWNPGRKN